VSRPAGLAARPRNSKKVVFDSSFLVAIAESPTTWFEDITMQMGGFEPTLLVCVKNELKRLSLAETKKARFASLALQIAEDFALEPSGDGRVDDEILAYATAHGATVATVDSKLINAMKARHARVVGLKGGRAALL